MEAVTILFGDSLQAQAKSWLEEMGKSDGERLRKLLELSRSPKIRLSEVLATLFPGDDTQTALANLTRLRNRLNDAGEELGLRFEADTKKKSPPEQREVWFMGPDATVLRATKFSEAVTADVVGRTFVPSKGIATTGSAMAAGKRVVRFFVSYAHDNDTLVRALMKELETQFRPSKRYELTLWTDREIQVGEKWNDRILTAIEDCDFGLFMVSPAFLGSKYIGDNEIPPFVGEGDRKPVIPVGVVPVSFDRHDLKGLREQQIFFARQRCFDLMRSSTEKRDFAHQLYLAIEKRLDAYFAKGSGGAAARGEGGETLGLQAGVPAVLRAGAACPGEEEVERFMQVPEETRHFQRTKGFAHHLAQREALDPAKASLGEARDALDELEAWALRADGAPFFALLGEVGIGKTTTLKQFTRLLIEKRQKEPGKKYPLPLYIDLRDYVGDTPGAVPTIDELLTSVIQRAWRVTDRTITAADLLRLVREENALIIFDGLDEKIVHLTPDRARDFIRTLWSVLPHAMLPRSGDVSSPPSSGKLLLSCRSHYFRDVWSQNAMLTGEDREGIDRSHYPAFCLLPFDEQLIRNYLTSFLGDEKRGSEAFDLIASIHNLRDLAERPYLLTLISGRLNELEALQMRGETVNAARLYDLVVRSWLSRDDGKHQLDPAHKRRLMEGLAAALWRSGEKQWDVDRLEEWLDEFLHQNPAIASAYAGKNRSLLKEDLRTATFVLRPDTADSQFRFAHTSLQEYFLAAYLVRALKDKADERWDMPMVSRETLDFLGQILRVENSSAAVQSLERILGADCLPAACLAFQYWLDAVQQGHPEPDPRHVNLSGANLEEKVIKGRDKQHPLKLRGANLQGVQLNRARIEFVDFCDADLSGGEMRQALLINVNAARAKITRTDLAGAQWRKGSIEDADLTGTDINGTQFIFVDGNPDPRVSASGSATVEIFSGHQKGISTVAWNPRRPIFVSTSQDNTLRLWDAESASEIMVIRDSAGMGASCDWSPDGSCVVSNAFDGTIKVWDLTTGREKFSIDSLCKTMTRSCRWSPGEPQLLSSIEGPLLRLWDARDGRFIRILEEEQTEILASAWSPDGRSIACGCENGALIVWDALLGTKRATYWVSEREVLCCAWSPDGGSIAAGTTDGQVTIISAVKGDIVEAIVDIGPVLCLCWHKDSTKIFYSVVTPEAKYVLYDLRTKIAVVEAQDDMWVCTCSWSPDGSRLLLGDAGGRIKVLEASNMRSLLIVERHLLLDHPCLGIDDDRSEMVRKAEDAPEFVSEFSAKFIQRQNKDTNLIIWRLHALPENQSVIITGDRKNILHATPEAWRWLGWEERDAKGRFIRRLPAEVFGPIPGMED